jgi:hypothetical protein
LELPDVVRAFLLHERFFDVAVRVGATSDHDVTLRNELLSFDLRGGGCPAVLPFDGCLLECDVVGFVDGQCGTIKTNKNVHLRLAIGVKWRAQGGCSREQLRGALEGGDGWSDLREGGGEGDPPEGFEFVEAVEARAEGFFQEPWRLWSARLSRTLSARGGGCDDADAVISVIFKIGDDLRNDEVVTQLIQIFNRVVGGGEEEGGLRNFGAVATHPQGGMVEVLRDNEALKDVLKVGFDTVYAGRTSAAKKNFFVALSRWMWGRGGGGRGEKSFLKFKRRDIFKKR